jgi:hypothetical protein
MCFACNRRARALAKYIAAMRAQQCDTMLLLLPFALAGLIFFRFSPALPDANTTNFATNASAPSFTSKLRFFLLAYAEKGINFHGPSFFPFRRELFHSKVLMHNFLFGNDGNFF